MVVKINLMPEKIKGGMSSAEGLSLFFLLTLIAMIISGFAYGGVLFYKNYFLKTDLVAVKAKNEALNSQINEKFGPKDAIINKKAIEADKILTDHLYWSKFYDILESLTIKDVFYDSFAAVAVEDAPIAPGAGKNEAKLIKARVAGNVLNFRSLAKQLAVFRANADLLAIDFEEAQMSKDNRVDFVFTFKFSPSLIKNNPSAEEKK